MMSFLEKSRKTSILLGVCIFTASATGAIAEENSVFVRDATSAQTYQGDSAACKNYAKSRGASEGASAGGAVVGALIGGIFGGAMVSGSLDRTRERLFEECMSLKGYRLLALPPGIGTVSRTEEGEFDRFKTGLSLVEGNKADEIIAWENAKNFSGPKRLQRYLKLFPNGHFAVDARKRLADGGILQSGAPK